MSVNSQLKEIEASLGEINKLTSDIANNWSKAGGGNTGRAGMSGGPATNAASFTGTTSGGGGAGGSGGGGMGGLAMGALGSMGGGLLKGLANTVGDALLGQVPSGAAAGTRAQGNFNYNMMNSWSGASGANMAKLLRSFNPSHQSSSGGVNAMMSGLASQGITPATMGGESGYVNMASSYMRMHEYGISNAEIPGWSQSTYSAESSNRLKLMLGGNKGTVDSEGNLRAPEDITKDVWDFTMPRVGNMSSAEIMKQMQSGRAMDINLKETGQEWMRPQMEEMAGVYAWMADPKNKKAKESLEEESGWDTENLTQAQIRSMSGIDSGENPQELSDNLTQARAESDAAMDDSKLKGVKDANNATVKYLHYLSDMPDVRGLLATLVTHFGAEEGTPIGGKIAAMAGEWAGGSDAGATAVQKQKRLRAAYLENKDSIIYQEGEAGENVAEQYEAHQARVKAGLSLDEEWGDSNRVDDWDMDQTDSNDDPGGKAGSALGDWNVEKDKNERVHTGELIIPSRIATQVRKDLARGGRPIDGTPADQVSRGKIAPTTASGPASGSTPEVNLIFNVNVQRASETEVQYLAKRIQHILGQQASLQAVSAGTF